MLTCLLYNRKRYHRKTDFLKIAYLSNNLKTEKSCIFSNVYHNWANPTQPEDMEQPSDLQLVYNKFKNVCILYTHCWDSVVYYNNNNLRYWKFSIIKLCTICVTKRVQSLPFFRHVIINQHIWKFAPAPRVIPKVYCRSKEKN